MIPFYMIRTAILHEANLDLHEYAVCQILAVRGGSQLYGDSKKFTEIGYNEIGLSINVTGRSAIRICKRLIEKGLIEKDKKDPLRKRVTKKWEQLVLSPENRGDETSRGGDETSQEGGDETSQEGGDETSQTLYKYISKSTFKNTKENFSPNISADSQQMQEEKNTPQFPPNPPKKEKEFSAQMMACKSYEKAREKFQVKNGLQPDVFSWDNKALADLEKVTVRLKEKMRVNGRTWEHDKDFTQKYLAPFFEAAAISHIWFNSIFSIGIMANRFADTYDEIIMQKNGNTKAARNNDPNGHLISAEDAARATANVIARRRAKEQRRAS